jgi:hypothetical protein
MMCRWVVDLLMTVSTDTAVNGLLFTPIFPEFFLGFVNFFICLSIKIELDTPNFVRFKNEGAKCWIKCKFNDCVDVLRLIILSLIGLK